MQKQTTLVSESSRSPRPPTSPHNVPGPRGVVAGVNMHMRLNGVEKCKMEAIMMAEQLSGMRLPVVRKNSRYAYMSNLQKIQQAHMAEHTKTPGVQHFECPWCTPPARF
eukprot:GDKI01034773.1.p4 GENE.GDKI01034773.1~~GDKI01034773.1.p4  ORF type:complete len:109 (+),score=28.01 GDKI01034773.1:259-585(+)